MLLSAAYDRYRLKLARPPFPGRAVALIQLLSDLLAQPRQPGLVLGDQPTTGPPPVAQCALVTCTLTAAPPLTPAASVVLAGVPTS
jgi:hypothetical protein